MSISESLASPNPVRLFGRIMAGLKVDDAAAGQEMAGDTTLRQLLKDEKARLALIFAYSFEGRYAPLARPALFLVQGDGEPATNDSLTSGVAAKGWTFEKDIKYWIFDRDDFSLRLDLESGPMSRILLEAESGGGEMPYFRGAHTQFRGAHTQFRGAHTRLRGDGE